MNGALNGLPAPSAEIVASNVSTALTEDVGSGDATAHLIPDHAVLKTRVICRDTAIICGQPWFDETFRQIGGEVSIQWHIGDGRKATPNDTVCTLNGSARTILTGERTALNFLQTLSASATLARQYVDAVRHTRAIILDTRKTLPGLRVAQKYAVRCGGAMNHRMGLYDAILIKENHIAAAGSISAAVAEARSLYPDLLLEVEVENSRQLAEAVAAGAQRALLDNFPLSGLQQAVQEFQGRISLEASGGVSLNTVAAIAETGVDFISTGELTKHIRAVDFSMRFT